MPETYEDRPRMIKRPKHTRACSLCRRKKIRCDASEKPDLRCSKCAMYGVECHYDDDGTERRPVQVDVQREPRIAQPRDTAPQGHASHQWCSYAEMLECRLRTVEELLSKLRSDGTTREASEDSATQSSLSAITRSAPDGFDHLPSYSAIRVTRLNLPDSDNTSEADSSEADSEGPRKSVSDGSKYHGKSSNDFLVRTLAEIKAGWSDHPSTWNGPGFDSPPPQQGVTNVISSRPLFEELPPPDLLQKLVDAYFAEFNVYLPLLHRPTFEQCIQEALHVRDDGFCAVVLLVCANGSRWVKDERLNRSRGHPPGMHWFERAGRVSSVFLESRLYDLQALILTVAYLNGTDSPYGTWTVIGVGIRIAQEVGAHRKKRYSCTPNVEDELWRRAFWVLVAMDRMTSFGMGRPCLIQDEDFDLDPMTECDDEYWTPADPTLAFTQPPGRPSKVAFANCLMRLLRILAFASRTIYTTNKSKLLFGFVGPEWKQGIVAELDSALNRWIDSVPEHLRWDSNIQDPTFFNQSATLYANYYQAQICVHRQFLSSRRNKPALASLPSLTICTTAARSCLRVLYAQYLRNGLPKCTLSPLLVPLHTAAMVLVIALSAESARSGPRREREVEELADDIGRCFEMLLSTEPYHQGVGKFRAALHALLIPERPCKLGQTGPASCNANADEEPRFVGADDLGELTVAMMNNLSISDPNADLEDVGPSWGHPAEAPFYGLKSTSSYSKQTRVPVPAPVRTSSLSPGLHHSQPSEGRVRDGLIQSTSAGLYGAPTAAPDVVVQDPLLQGLQPFPAASHIASTTAAALPAFGDILLSPSVLISPHDGTIDFSPFFADNDPGHSYPSRTLQTGGMPTPSMAREHEPSPFTMVPVPVPRGQVDWSNFLRHDTAEGF